MKHLFYIVTLLFLMTSCQKSDAKMEKLIKGTWVVKVKEAILPYAPDKVPTNIPGKFEVIENDQFLIYSGFGVNTPCSYIPNYSSNSCTTEYYIKDGILNVLLQPDSNVLEFYPYKIHKINQRKMVLSYGEGENWTYLKQ